MIQVICFPWSLTSPAGTVVRFVMRVYVCGKEPPKISTVLQHPHLRLDVKPRFLPRKSKTKRLSAFCVNPCGTREVVINK